MTWTNPTLRTTGDIVAVATWNTEVVQDISYLGSLHAHSGNAGDGGDLGLIVPTGMIGVFDAACPSGWTRVSALDGYFVKGSTSYGATGGGSSHVHGPGRELATTTDLPLVPAPPPPPPDASSFLFALFDEVRGDLRIIKVIGWPSWDPTGESHEFAQIPAFTGSSGLGGTSEPYPPYIDVVFCKKD